MNPSTLRQIQQLRQMEQLQRLRRLQGLSETDLWEVATNRQQPRSLRQAAMERWLFPSDYGYAWAGERNQKLKKLWEEELNATWN